jgi:hypothetical protein
VTNFDYAEIKSGVQEGESILLVEPDRQQGGGAALPEKPPGGSGSSTRKRS